MQILFFRHSMTAGNFERRYLGCKTDEPLCPEGIAFATQQAKQISCRSRYLSARCDVAEKQHPSYFPI